MCIPMTPNHVRLIDSCYPHHSALLATAPDYRPNSQELSRLTYYASNRPGKLPKITSYLEKRAKNEAAKAKYGNAKQKASLLITLAIFRSLTVECRRELAVFSRTVIVVVGVAVTSLPNDIEVAARAASVFTAWTTYTDGGLIGVDDQLTKSYLAVSRHYGHLCLLVNNNDAELRNRSRLLGLAAISGIVASDALYASLTEFQAQIPILAPALIQNIAGMPISTLNDVCATMETQPQPTSPYLAEIQQRPPLSQRRAASIHVHIDGEKGPSTLDVAEAALRALKTIFQQSNAAQIARTIGAIVGSLDSSDVWSNVEFCCWLADRALVWSQYQYRFAVPTRLVDLLLRSQDTPVPTARLMSFMAMLTTVFTSPISLVNFSTSDVLTNLITVLLRRVAIDPEDGLVPALVQCVSSLGTHVYYADQIQDLAEELITRLVNIQLNGISGEGPSSTNPIRAVSLRCLVLCLKGLIETANRSSGMKKNTSSSILGESSRTMTEPIEFVLERHDSTGIVREDYSPNPRKNNISPELWQETIAVLCETDFSVRSSYAQALLTFLLVEVPREPYAVDPAIANREDGKGVRLPAPGRPLTAPDATTRLLHAIHASVFHLALAPSLGFRSGAPSEASEDFEQHVQVDPPTPDVTSSRFGEIEMNEQLNRPSPSRRRLSRALTALLGTPAVDHMATATFSDYAFLLNILTTLHRRLPGRALLVGVPMLVAMDTTANSTLRDGNEATHGRARAVKALLGRVWEEIGEIWDSDEIRQHAQEALSTLPKSISLADPATPPLGTNNVIEDPVAFPTPTSTDESKFPFINAEAMVTALASNDRVQAVLGLDKQGVLKRLVLDWTEESAVHDSIETQHHPDVLRGEGASALRKISPALMHIDNISLQSVARSGKGGGVDTLREALEGRALGASASVTTFDRISSQGHGNLLVPTSRPASAGRERMLKSSASEVRDALDKLGIGKQTQANGKLRSPFPIAERLDSETKTSVLVPPYRS
ncbi:hypothetical protein CALVIDRAFT_533671 [Calocera viscosa TUFC12733]|uniref:Protein EFR3 n=1 Tax=Calocera viscosa (strain TUFC12733) TaxID=1330018 RepID=A0A167QJV2_CALVF|nr:hypothetical protein CALVIDRAFT_533671 [Calocera viscosa TUFC12733]